MNAKVPKAPHGQTRLLLASALVRSRAQASARRHRPARYRSAVAEVGPRPFVEHPLTSVEISRKVNVAFEEALDATSFAALSTAGAVPPARPALYASSTQRTHPCRRLEIEGGPSSSSPT